MLILETDFNVLDNIKEDLDSNNKQNTCKYYDVTIIDLANFNIKKAPHIYGC